MSRIVLDKKFEFSTDVTQFINSIEGIHVLAISRDLNNGYCMWYCVPEETQEPLIEGRTRKETLLDNELLKLVDYWYEGGVPNMSKQDFIANMRKKLFK